MLSLFGALRVPSLRQVTENLSSTGHEASDPVIKLVAAIFRIAEIEKRAIEAGYASLLSPEVSSTVMWFLRCWTLTYLLAQECYYSEIRLECLVG